MATAGEALPPTPRAPILRRDRLAVMVRVLTL
jgi:hypothetical protein